MIASLVVGAFFVVGGVLLRPRTRSGDLRTTGTVAQSWAGTALGDPAWLYTVEFRDAEGVLWRFRPPLTSLRQRSIGAQVQVAYSPDDPAATARKTDGLDGQLPWLVMGVGMALIAGAVLLG